MEFSIRRLPGLRAPPRSGGLGQRYCCKVHRDDAYSPSEPDFVWIGTNDFAAALK